MIDMDHVGENAQKRTKKTPMAQIALGEVSGAFGDLGTLLPYIVGILVAGVLAPGPVFFGFAMAYLTVALVYRMPVPVQPMKAIGAVVLAGGLNAAGIAWSGAILGAILLGLALLPKLTALARAIPQSVLVGLQAGLGLTLGAFAFSLMREGWFLAVPTLALLSLSFLWARGPWALLAVIAAVVGGGFSGTPAPVQITLPEVSTMADAVFLGVIPQLPLTLLNAVVLTVAVSHTLYGPAARRVTERKLAVTTGFLNLALVPFGAFPMCHGAGGVAAHKRFGARTMAAPLVMAAICAAAALFGPQVVTYLSLIPMPIIGALLAYASVELAFNKRLIDARPDCRPVIAAAAVVTLFAGAAFGLVAGLLAECIRGYAARHRAQPRNS